MSIVHVIPSAAEPAAPSTPEVLPQDGRAASDARNQAESSARRWWRKRAGPNPWKGGILACLEKPGCFICREAAASLQRYYFWFLAEQYANTPTIHRLQRAHGFCLRHTRHLLERGVPERVSYVGGYVLRFCAEWLQALQGATPERRGSRADQVQAFRSLRPTVGCPACEQERAMSGLYAHVIVGCLEDPDIVRALRASDGLCLPHFLESARVAEWEALRCLVEEQIRHLEEARANLSASHLDGTDGTKADALREAVRRLYGPDLDA